MGAAQVIAIARAEVGYLEKATNRDLDSKTGNAGCGNWTKYARDLAAAGYYNGNKNGYAWCDVFVDWCFFKAYGAKAEAEAVECQTGTLGAGCEYSMRYYQQAGRFSNTPQVGDQIFFRDVSGEICHTGLVYAVTDSAVYTVEGNTSSASGVVSNGGGVAEKSYVRSDSRIAGYGHPKYEAAEKALEYFWPYRKFQNGAAETPVYKDSDMSIRTGSLNPWETCYCTGRYGGAYAVLYRIDGTADNWALGYAGCSGENTAS